MTFSDAVEAVGRTVDATGVVVIAGGLVWVTLATIKQITRPATPGQKGASAYQSYRRLIGKVILLGLELLVAADIVRTVAVAPTLEGVAVLGLIVLVRTFLSFSLEVELYGRWPWTRSSPGAAGEPPPESGM